MASPTKLGTENHRFNAGRATTTENITVWNFVLSIDFGCTTQPAHMKRPVAVISGDGGTPQNLE